MEKSKTVKFFLYNYDNLDEMIKEREEEILDKICDNKKNWLIGVNTLETQAINVIEDKVILNIKRWQVLIKSVLVFCYKNYSIYYKFIKLKYFEKKLEHEIAKELKLSYKQIKIIDGKIIQLLVKKANIRNLV